MAVYMSYTLKTKNKCPCMISVVRHSAVSVSFDSFLSGDSMDSYLIKDCLIHIFTFLTEEDLIRASSVCKVMCL